MEVSYDAEPEFWRIVFAQSKLFIVVWRFWRPRGEMTERLWVDDGDDHSLLGSGKIGKL